MTTQSWSTVVDHSGDAGFRAWGSEFAVKLAAAGLVQTADTGQVNWVTVTRPGTNTEGGYEIWRFNDSLQATAPIFIRIGYGTGGTATTPRMQFTVGTSSNGTGTIGGTALTTARTAGGGAPASTVTAYQSLMCATTGFFGFAWKIGGSTALVPMHWFFINRTCDATGAFDIEGSMVFWGVGQTGQFTAYQFLRYAATAAAFTARTGATEIPVVVPGIPTSSLVGSDNQAYLWWSATPRVKPVLGVCTIVRSEVSVTSTFTVTLVGSTPHTYIAVGQACNADPTATAAYGPAMLWE